MPTKKKKNSKKSFAGSNNCDMKKFSNQTKYNLTQLNRKMQWISGIIIIDSNLFIKSLVPTICPFKRKNIKYKNDNIHYEIFKIKTEKKEITVIAVQNKFLNVMYMQYLGKSNTT